jgi:ferritin-like metal-binding protein YciE
MPVNPKEVFVWMLSDVRRGAERSVKLFQELSELAQDEEIKEALGVRVFVAEEISKKLNECFRLIGAQPVKLDGKLQEIFAEDFHCELSAIQSPEAKRLFVLAKAIHLLHLRMGEYVALIEAADLTSHYAVGVLLESCLAEEAAFIERTRQLTRKRVALGLAAAA